MSESRTPVNESQKIPMWQKICYGCGAGGGNVMSTLLASFLLSYYTDTALIGAAAIGTMFVVCRLLDGVTDFLMGGIVDKTNTRLGKARPWLLVCAPLMFLGIVLILSVPQSWSEAAKLVYAYATYIFLNCIVYTIFGIAHTALLAMNIPNGEFLGEEGRSFAASCAVRFAVDQFGPIDFRRMDEQARANGVSFADHDQPHSAESSYMGGPLPALSDDWLAKVNPTTYLNEGMAPLLVEHGCVDKLVPFAQSVNFVNAIYRTLGPGRVEFVPLPNADHEDREFSSDWNMDVLWQWIAKQL